MNEKEVKDYVKKLSSPVHGLLGKNTMLISFKGRKSGKKYSVTIMYAQNNSVILATSYRHRIWWRNLLEGVPVTLLVRGQTLKGIGKVITREADVAKHLQAYLQIVPTHAKYFNVTLDPDGKPDIGDVAQAARDRVGIRIELKTK